MNKTLSKILRNTISNNGYIAGSKEVLKSRDNAKFIICSSTLNKIVKEKIEAIYKERNIPIYNTDNTSRELGRLCNKPFRISVLALTNIEGDDLELLLKEINTS